MPAAGASSPSNFADTRGTLLNLLGRDQDLAHVLVGLAEMPLQMQYPIVHPGDVVHEMADLVMDLVRRLAHARIPPDLLDDMNGQHEQRGRNDDDVGAKCLLHDILEPVMQLHVDGFGGHEHQRQVLRLARDQVFFRNVADMPGKVRAQPSRGLLALLIARCVAKRAHRLERKLGVDHQRTSVREEHRAVGTALV